MHVRRSITLLLVSALLHCVIAVHDSLNFVIHSGKRSCFYEHYATGAPPRTIDAFVQSGSGAQLQIFGPLSLDEIRMETFNALPVLLARIEPNKESVSDTQSFTHEFVPALEGTYALCLDNSQSSFMDNVVQLDVRYGPKEGRYEIARIKSKSSGKSDKEDAPSVPDEDMLKSLESISRLRKGLVAIQIEQLRDRRRLNLYSENNRTNRSEIIIASLAETAVFVLAAVFQIYFVRNWFAKRAAAVAQNGNPTGATKLSA